MKAKFKHSYFRPIVQTINKLEVVDMAVLKEIIKQGVVK